MHPTTTRCAPAHRCAPAARGQDQRRRPPGEAHASDARRATPCTGTPSDTNPSDPTHSAAHPPARSVPRARYSQTTRPKCRSHSSRARAGPRPRPREPSACACPRNDPGSPPPCESALAGPRRQCGMTPRSPKPRATWTASRAYDSTIPPSGAGAPPPRTRPRARPTGQRRTSKRELPRRRAVQTAFPWTQSSSARPSSNLSKRQRVGNAPPSTRSWPMTTRRTRPLCVLTLPDSVVTP